MANARFAILAVLVSLLAAACDDPPRAAKVTVTPSAVDMTSLSATEQLAAQVLDQNGDVMPGVDVSWSSGDPAIATVSATGLVKSAGNGTATVTATAEEASGTASVKVMQAAASVTVSPLADTVEIGDTVRLTAVALDANGHAVVGAEFTWSSSDEAVATVDGLGLVRGVAERSATITATAEALGGERGDRRVPPGPGGAGGALPGDERTELDRERQLAERRAPGRVARLWSRNWAT